MGIKNDECLCRGLTYLCQRDRAGRWQSIWFTRWWFIKTICPWGLMWKKYLTSNNLAVIPVGPERCMAAFHGSFLRRGCDKRVFWMTKLPIWDKATFPRIVAACMHSLLHIPWRGPQRNMPGVPCMCPCPTSELQTCLSCDGNALLLSNEWTPARPSGRRLCWTPAVGHSLQECSRHGWGRVLIAAPGPRELCQIGREEKTRSCDTQWVRARTPMSYLQCVCLHTVACEAALRSLKKIFYLINKNIPHILVVPSVWP